MIIKAEEFQRLQSWIENVEQIRAGHQNTCVYHNQKGQIMSWIQHVEYRYNEKYPYLSVRVSVIKSKLFRQTGPQIYFVDYNAFIELSYIVKFLNSEIDKEKKETESFENNAFVAMQFGDDTKTLREAIRTAISSVGYHADFIDEVEHNDFISIVIMEHIRKSRFVVADLSHQNNGAYFEEGYAMGLGKPVIQLCKDDIKLHFDIAQKNTIMWKSVEEIPERLANRIKATIE